MKNQPIEVTQRFEQYSVGDVVISAITYAELQFGVTISTNPERERSNVESLIADIPVAPFDAASAIAYGPIRFATRDSRRDAIDKLIAAHAASLGAIVVTNNVRDFAKYPGIVVENWLTPTS